MISEALTPEESEAEQARGYYHNVLLTASITGHFRNFMQRVDSTAKVEEDPAPFQMSCDDAYLIQAMVEMLRLRADTAMVIILAESFPPDLDEIEAQTDRLVDAYAANREEYGGAIGMVKVYTDVFHDEEELDKTANEIMDKIYSTPESVVLNRSETALLPLLICTMRAVTKVLTDNQKG